MACGYENELRAEIARLRMTAAERGAIQEVIDYLQPAGSKYQNAVAATLQQLLARCATAGRERGTRECT